MATYGFLATNNSGQVLISSKTKNLHFLGKATFFTTLQIRTGHGGLRSYVYRITSNATPVPFFTTPGTDRYAVVRMTLVSNNLWDIELIKSGFSDIRPEVYVFTEVSGQVKPYGSWGMKILNESSGTTFDSRLRPLVVKGGTSIAPPYSIMSTDPPPGTFRSGSCESFTPTDQTVGVLVPDVTNTTYISNVPLTKPIVSYQSIAQGQKSIKSSGSHSFGNSIFSGGTRYYNSNYWIFCRSGLSLAQSGSTLVVTTGWITVNNNCWSEIYTNGTGLVGSDIPTRSGGTWPFENSSINMNPVPLIVSDGNLYD